MNDTMPHLEGSPSAARRAGPARELPHPRIGWVALPEDLFAQTRAYALDVRLHHRALFGTWTKFRRVRRSEHAIPIPAPTSVAPGIARFRLSASCGGHNHVELRLPALRDERFVGFGERFNAVDQRGQCLEVWTEEGAIGLGERLSRWLTRFGVSWNPFPKGPTTSYKPFPWMISSRGYGLFFDTTSPVFYDVAKSDPDLIVCEIAARDVDVILFYDAEPKQLVQRFVQMTGKSRGLPDWAFAPWNDAIRGEDEVRRVATRLRQEKIPSSAIWTEDWQNGHWSFFGDTRWSFYNINPVRRDVDRRTYPHVESLAKDLHDEGFKFLGYCYPYVPIDDDDYAAAAEKGLFLRSSRGTPALVQIFTSRCAQLDLTNPETCAWHKAQLQNALRLGFDGWMADFGEYTPIDSMAYSGMPGLELHNAFPLLWAKQNREAMDEAEPRTERVFFSRSAAPGQQAYTSVFWSGDSNTDFERWDGLPSNVPGLLSSSLSGLAIWTVDVGGYMSLFTTGRDEETLARWTELAALLPVMRTHHGTHPRRSVQFDANARTLAHYATYARLHTAFFPMFRSLVDAAVRDGTPVCRPLLMEFPSDGATWAVEDQFMVGSDLLVAPVVSRGAVSRSVYLPVGARWIDLWTGRVHEGASSIEVQAPLGTLPLFLRDGGFLALFDRHVDTLARRLEVTDRRTRTLDDAEASLSFVLTPSFVGPAVVYDGTTIDVRSNGPSSSLMPASPISLELLPDALTRNWKLLARGIGTNGGLPIDSPPRCGLWLEVTATRQRTISVYAVGASSFDGGQRAEAEEQ